MTRIQSVAIIGGGVGGLTVANCLKRLGLSVSLYERSPYFIPTAGAGFGLQPNGQICLESIGFKEQTEKLIHPIQKWQIINDHGEIVSTSNRFNEHKARFGYNLSGTVRAELIDVLKEPIEKTGDLYYSHNLIDIQQDSNEVTLTFENNKQQKLIKTDMVIGADGIHSTVVRKIFSQTAPPTHSKENIFYGLIDNIDQQTIINSSITEKHTLTQYFGRGEFISYRVGRQGKFIWAATYPSNQPPTTGNDTEWIVLNNQRQLKKFLERFPLSHPVHQCAQATNQERLLHFGLYYRQHRNDPWHTGRICLLGDSCHATLPYVGQGANLAIEDAITLASCLEKSNFHLESAFEDYYKKRFNRTKRVVNMARYMGLFLHSENPIIHSIRQRLIPWLMNSDIALKMAEKELYENCPVPLKDKKTVV